MSFRLTPALIRMRRSFTVRCLYWLDYIYGGITRLFWHLGQHRKANHNTLLADATADTETRGRANTLTFARY